MKYELGKAKWKPYLRIVLISFWVGIVNNHLVFYVASIFVKINKWLFYSLMYYHIDLFSCSKVLLLILQIKIGHVLIEENTAKMFSHWHCHFQVFCSGQFSLSPVSSNTDKYCSFQYNCDTVLCLSNFIFLQM